MVNWGDVASNQVLDRFVDFTVSDFRATGPAITEDVIGITPVLRFTTATQFLASAVPIGPGWDITKDVKLLFAWAIEGSALDSDVLNADLDWHRVGEADGAEDLNRAVSAADAAVTVTTANGLGDGDIYLTTHTIEFDDANNAFQAGTSGISFILNVNVSSDLLPVNILAGRLVYASSY